MIFDEGQHLYVKVGVKRVAAAAATTTDVVITTIRAAAAATLTSTSCGIAAIAALICIISLIYHNLVYCQSFTSPPHRSKIDAQ